MYYKHTLRTRLQEWRNRLYKASANQFGSQVTFFFNSLDKEPLLKGLINDASSTFNVNDEYVKNWITELDYDYYFDNPKEQAACFYHLSKYLIKKWKNPVHLLNFEYVGGDGYEEKRSNYVETFINPIVEYLHDQLDESNSLLYLFEKYKMRTEAFKREELFTKYKTAEKSYEDILEDNLRLYLFDQGIDYPFSTPKSFSGRSDIVGLIDTKNPLVAEIKIWDSGKKYGKSRVYSGFSQIVKYANDYNKNVGYLVIFNLDNIELDFDFGEDIKKFPPRMTFNGKTFYFIVINLFPDYTASKLGKTKTVNFTKDEMTENIQTL